MKKYELVNYNGQTELYQIKALKSFGNVKEGDLGVLYSADDSMCTYSTKMLLESNEKSQKAFRLDLMAETQRYINETRYYTKQVLINCDEKDERYKVAKELLDSYRRIDKESGR